MNGKARREAVPELERLIERVAPALMRDAAVRKSEALVSDEWRAFVASLRSNALASAAQWKIEHADEEITLEERRGYEWSFAIDRISAMVEHLSSVIRDDIGIEEGSTIASMLLLRKALDQLNLELKFGGDPQEDYGDEEERYRVVEALRALSPKFDDMNMRRFRAVWAARKVAPQTIVPTADEIDACVERMRTIARDEGYEFDEAESRAWFAVKQPIMNGILARKSLAEVDDRFRSLDPLIVAEEFSEARIENGGRSDGGEGRTGPIRAVARLAVMCGALDFEQKECEEFDEAVERARNVLNVACTRVRKTLRESNLSRPKSSRGREQEAG